MRRYRFIHGLGDAATDELVADGIPSNIINSWTTAHIAQYNIFKGRGFDAEAAYGFAQVSNKNFDMINTLFSAGMTNAEFETAWEAGFFDTDNPGPQLNNGQLSFKTPASAVYYSLIMQSAAGWLQTLRDAIAALPAAQQVSPTVLPPTPALPTPTPTPAPTPTPTVYVNNTPPTPAQIQTAQASIPVTDPYWTFPSGDIENPDGTVTPAAAVGVTAPIDMAGISITPAMLAWGAGGAALLLLMFSGKSSGARR